ncbi:MAG: DUF2892 domain-containing protein [Anaerolineales bacterium]|nr:DUF2892 domain-containing protein [Anaerolineales bacterium]
MQKYVNEAGWDRIARVVGGLAMIAVWLTGVVAGGVGWVVGLLGIVLLVTGLVGICPLYLVFKFRTNRN